jgi:cysteine synthase
MKKTLDEADKRAMKKHVINIVENGLPLLKWAPTPSFVKSQPWRDAAKKVMICLLSAGDLEILNGKLQPALKTSLMDEADGKFTPDTIYGGASSANWAAMMAAIAPIFPYRKFCPIIERSVPQGKIEQLEANGVSLDDILWVPEGSVGTDYAYELAQRMPNFLLADQYTHRGSVLGHKWTMDHVIHDLPRLQEKAWKSSHVFIGEDLSFSAAVTGTCSTVAAMDEFLRPAFPAMKVWGVASMPGKEKVPGSRSKQKLDELKRIGGGFNYEKAIDGELIQSVTLDEAYSVNAEIVSPHFMDVGPTVALAVAGVWHRLGEYWMSHHESFDGLVNDAGIVLGFIYGVDKRIPYLGDPAYRKYFQN